MFCESTNHSTTYFWKRKTTVKKLMPFVNDKVGAKDQSLPGKVRNGKNVTSSKQRNHFCRQSLGNGKMSMTPKNREVKFCSHCKRNGHDVKMCWYVSSVQHWKFVKKENNVKQNLLI